MHVLVCHAVSDTNKDNTVSYSAPETIGQEKFTGYETYVGPYMRLAGNNLQLYAWFDLFEVVPSILEPSSIL